MKGLKLQCRKLGLIYFKKQKIFCENVSAELLCCPISFILSHQIVLQASEMGIKFLLKLIERKSNYNDSRGWEIRFSPLLFSFSLVLNSVYLKFNQS